MPTPRLRLGQLLVDARMISAEALDEVLALQRTDGRRLGTLLVERGLINETQLTQILSHQLSVPWVSLLHIEFSRQLLNLVPRDVADRFCLVPIYVRHVRNQGDTLYVAMEDPTNEDALAACREHAGLPVRSMIAPPTDIRAAIRVYYGVDSRPARSGPAPSTPAARTATTAPPPVDDGAGGLRPQAPAEAQSAEAVTAPSTPRAEAPPTFREPAVNPADTVEPPPEVAPPAASSPGEAAAPADDPEQEMVAERAPASGVVSSEGPEIEAVEIPLDPSRAEKLRGILDPPPTPPPPSSPAVENIPRPRGRAPRMVSLTLLDGTTINLPAKRRGRPAVVEARVAPEAAEARVAPDQAPSPGASDAPGPYDSFNGLTARDLVLALRVVAGGADASEVLGENIRWESLFSALLSLMLRKHLIADWEFIDELKKQL